MIPGRRFRRRSGSPDGPADEGPFVSFTDLFIGILFLFLILVAALMLMHQEAIQRLRREADLLAEQARILQAQLDAAVQLNPPFRLALTYNAYQRSSGNWTYNRTVQVFRTANGLCLEHVLLRNNLNLSWKDPIDPGEIPTVADQDEIKRIAPCRISARGEHWDLESETGGVDRVSADLYSGFTELHKKTTDDRIELEYRVLGVYDDYFRYP